MRRHGMPNIAISPYATLHDYETSVRLAGGEPRTLDLERDDPAAVIREVDALLLPGGGDVDPSFYGEDRHPTFDARDTARDQFELELAKRARDANIPVLAICRGLQLLNVARGGSLVQDIPSQLATPLVHVRREPPDCIAHDVIVRDGSLLAELIIDGHGELCSSAVGTPPPAGATGGRVAVATATQNGASGRVVPRRYPVNSRHHQSIKRLGEELVITATADDGVVEAVEDPSMRFCVGVQWHPENFHRTGEFRALFEGFVRAGQSRR